MLSKWQLPPSSPVHTDLTKHGLGGSEGERRILEPEGLGTLAWSWVGFPPPQKK